MINTLYSNTAHSQQSSATSFQDAATSGKGSEAASQDALIQRLASNIPGMSVDDMKSLSADNFTPEKVANRIGDFVAQGLEAARRAGRSEEDIQGLYDSAVKGVQKGIAEAREILDGLSILSEPIAANIDKTEELTLESLAQLNPSAPQSNPSAPQSNDVAQSPAASSTLMGAERYQSAETLSLQVQTRDGDQVTIKFAQQSDYQSAFGADNNEAFFSLSRSESSAYQFSVEGDLDEQEIDALQNLIKDVSDISNEFFDGDLQAAFDMASEYRMDTRELSAMNLQLTQSEQYSVAQYKNVGNIESPMADASKRLGHMLQEMQDMTARPELAFLENSVDFGQALLDALVTQDVRYLEADDEQKQGFNDKLDSMRSLMSDLTEQPISPMA